MVERGNRKQKFRQLMVWDQAMVLIKETYQVTSDFPKEEAYGLTSQLRRAAVSVAMNIAEGSGSGSDPEFKRFLLISVRSCYEVMCGVEVAMRLAYVPETTGEALVDKFDALSAMLYGFIKKLKADSR